MKKETTPTETQTTGDALFDIYDALDMMQSTFSDIHTLLSDAVFDLSKVIKRDGSKEDNARIYDLINRRPVIETFVRVAITLLMGVEEDITQICEDVATLMKKEEKR